MVMEMLALGLLVLIEAGFSPNSPGGFQVRRDSVLKVGSGFQAGGFQCWSLGRGFNAEGWGGCQSGGFQCLRLRRGFSPVDISAEGWIKVSVWSVSALIAEADFKLGGIQLKVGTWFQAGGFQCWWLRQGSVWWVNFRPNDWVRFYYKSFGWVSDLIIVVGFTAIAIEFQT